MTTIRTGMLAGKATRGARRSLLGPIVLVATIAGCDFEVVNPGPVSDVFLDNPSAWPGIVGGVQQDLNGAIGNSFSGVSGQVAFRMRELIYTHNYAPLEEYYGLPRSVLQSSPWSNLHGARWQAENGIERLEGLLGAGAQSNRYWAELHLWAGYTLRYLGEFYCDAVLDGGPVLPGSTYLELAEAHFTDAISGGAAAGVAAIETAGYAGRASVRINRGDWSGALSDAGMVPDDFVQNLNFYDNSSRNGMIYDAEGLGWTVWNSYQWDYYNQTGDPRVPYVVGVPATVQVDALPEFDVIPRLWQQKMPTSNSPIRMSSGWEMRLIEAEGLLRQGAGQIPAAMAKINAVRGRPGVEMAPWPDPGSDLAAAWTHLSSEKAIELWLEGRRLGDRRRWAEDGVPVVLNDFEKGIANGGPDITNMSYCAPLPDSERLSNPNIPDA